jgi:hypothetical protein
MPDRLLTPEPYVCAALLQSAKDYYGPEVASLFVTMEEMNGEPFRNLESVRRDIIALLDGAGLRFRDPDQLGVLATSLPAASALTLRLLCLLSEFNVDQITAWEATNRATYNQWVRDCKAAQAAGDAERLKELRCKRDKHIMVPQGRLGLTGQQYGGWKGQEHPPGTPPREWRETDPQDFSKKVTAKTTTRWQAPDAPFAARTQSLATHRPLLALTARRKVLQEEIISAVEDYAVRSGFEAIGSVTTNTADFRSAMQDAGLSEKVIDLLAQSSPIILERRSEDFFLFLLDSLGGGFLQLGQESGRREVPIQLNTEAMDLRRLTGEFKRNKDLQALLQKATRGKTDESRKGGGRARSRRRPTSKPAFLTVRFVFPGNKEIAKARSVLELQRKLNASFAEMPEMVIGPRMTVVAGVKIIFALPATGEEATVELQHSDIEEGMSRVSRPDYSTGRQFSLDSLARRIAFKVYPAPRKVKDRLSKARKNPSPARNNPVSSLKITPMIAAELGEDLPPGGYKPITPGASLTGGPDGKGTGMFLYKGKKSGAVAQAVTAKRLNTWLATGERGKMLRKAVLAEETTELISNPSTRRRAMGRRRKSRRNPATFSYHDRAFASDSVLNRNTEWYYPGTLWDWYANAEYGPGESVPVNRRNPRGHRHNPVIRTPEGKKKVKVSELSTEEREMWKKGYHSRKIHGSPGVPNSRAQMIKRAAVILRQQTGQAKLTSAQARKLFGMSQDALSDFVSSQQAPAAPAPAPAQQQMPGMGGGSQSRRGKGPTVSELKAQAKQLGIRGYSGMKKAQLEAAIAGATAQSNPAYWPRYADYRRVMGPYGAHRSTPIPVNRRNPAVKPITARFPGKCAICNGEIHRGEQIADTGMRGPKGGKKMGHFDCL